MAAEFNYSKMCGEENFEDYNSCPQTIDETEYTDIILKDVLKGKEVLFFNIGKKYKIVKDNFRVVFGIFDSALQLTKKEYDKKTLELAELLKFLYTEENGNGIKLIGNILSKPVASSEIRLFREAIKKELSKKYFSKPTMSEIYSFIGIDTKELEDNPYSNFDKEDISIPIWDISLGGMEGKLVYYYLDYIDRQSIDKIIQREKEKEKGIQKQYISRLLTFICYRARKFGVFDKSLKTISTSEACFLYDSFDLLGLIQGDVLAPNQEKYQYIKGELRKTK